MKRFDIDADGDNGVFIQPHPAGDWVDADDAKDLIEAARAVVGAARRIDCRGTGGVYSIKDTAVVDALAELIKEKN